MLSDGSILVVRHPYGFGGICPGVTPLLNVEGFGGICPGVTPLLDWDCSEKVPATNGLWSIFEA